MNAADAAAEVMRLVREYASAPGAAFDEYLALQDAVKALAERAYPEATE